MADLDRRLEMAVHGIRGVATIEEAKEMLLEALPILSGIVTVGDFAITMVDCEVINDLLKREKKIKAIKHFREVTGSNLKDAKETVEKYFPRSI